MKLSYAGSLLTRQNLSRYYSESVGSWMEAAAWVVVMALLFRIVLGAEVALINAGAPVALLLH